jgi:hypothetical protein
MLMLTLLEREHMRVYKGLSCLLASDFPWPGFLFILLRCSLVRRRGKRAALGSKCLAQVGFLGPGFVLLCCCSRAVILGAVLDLGRENREELTIAFLRIAALLHI